MSIYTIEEIEKKVKEVAERYNVNKVCIFGSYARGEATEDSDIDFIVDPENLVGFKFFGFYEDLRESFNKEIDLVTESQIASNKFNPLYKNFIEELETDRKVIYYNNNTSEK